jgi:cytochrome oxidase Cu insertion factor (SCO1/SenC/PrrC family)
VSQQPGFYLLDHTMTTFVTDPGGRIAHRISSHDVPPAAAATLIRPLVGGLR